MPAPIKLCYLTQMICKTISAASKAAAKPKLALMKSLHLPELNISSSTERWLSSSIPLQPFLSFLPSPFRGNTANVIFHESCFIYQGQWHVEAADECLAPLDLYNERWESEIHSKVVSTGTEEVEMIYSASASQCFGEL